MKRITSTLLVAFSLSLLVTSANAQAQNAHNPQTGLTIPKGVAGAVDFTNAPKRENDKYPLSDQKNAKGWKLDKKHSDEFNGKELDSKKWVNKMPTTPGWKGRQPTYFHGSNITVEDGHAVFRTNKHGDFKLPEGYTHSSGFMNTHDTFLYGYFEARLKPNDSPWVTGFWMSNGTPTWWTEIDICENCPGVERNRQRLNSNIHVFRAPKEHGDVKKHFSISKTYHIPFELQKDFHTWGLEWDKDYIRFYIDGVLFREAENTHWHQPLRINVNNESNKWFGALPDDNRLDGEYLVDYVRIWKKKK